MDVLTTQWQALVVVLDLVIATTTVWLFLEFSQ